MLAFDVCVLRWIKHDMRGKKFHKKCSKASFVFFLWLWQIIDCWIMVFVPYLSEIFEHIPKQTLLTYIRLHLKEQID